MLVRLHYDHVDLIGRLLWSKAQKNAQISYRQEDIAPPEDRSGVNMLHQPGIVPFQADQFVQIDLRDHEAFSAGADHEPRNDRKREGNPHSDRCSVARFAEQFDRSADPLDMRLDHVHADPTSGDIGHFFRGGKARQEQQVEGIPIGEARRLVGGDQLTLDGFGLDTIRVDSRSVIRDFHVDLPAFVIRA